MKLCVCGKVDDGDPIHSLHHVPPVNSQGCKSEPEYPSFFRCIDALCAACGGAINNVQPAVLMQPFGWIHVWTKGNGHMKCAAERLWNIVPKELNEGRIR